MAKTSSLMGEKLSFKLSDNIEFTSKRSKKPGWYVCTYLMIEDSSLRSILQYVAIRSRRVLNSIITLFKFITVSLKITTFLFTSIAVCITFHIHTVKCSTYVCMYRKMTIHPFLTVEGGEGVWPSGIVVRRWRPAWSVSVNQVDLEFWVGSKARKCILCILP